MALVSAATVAMMALGGCTWTDRSGLAVAADADPPSSPAACDIGDPGPPSAQTLVLWVDSGGAFGPPQDWTKAWEIAAYRDGTVLRSTGYGFNSAPLSRTTIDRVGPCRVRDAVRGLRAFTTADLAIPLPTDMATTIISMRDGAVAPADELEVYALGQESRYLAEVPPPERDRERVGRAAANRATVSAFLVGLTADPQPWIPDRVRLVERTGEPYGDRPPTLTWPLGSFVEVMARRATVPACGEIAGQDATALLDSLANAPARSRWSDSYRTTLVAVAPLMPGQLGCPA